MKPLNITLPPDVFQAVLDGEKKFISHRRNPRIDRLFAFFPARAGSVSASCHIYSSLWSVTVGAAPPLCNWSLPIACLSRLSWSAWVGIAPPPIMQSIRGLMIFSARPNTA